MNASDRKMSTGIAQALPDRVEVRGFDLATEIIGSTTIAEYFYILLTGCRPTAQQAQVLDACVVAIAEHGLVPSVQAARMTYASAPEALHGAVAAGLLGCGSVILGSSETTADVLVQIVDDSRQSGCSIQAAAEKAVGELKASARAVPGVGHPLHRSVDPRAKSLLAYGDQVGTNGPYVAALRAMVDAIPAIYGRTFALNVSGAIPAVLLDAGFPGAAMKAIPLVGRTISLVAHLLEEKRAPIGFGLAAAAEEAVAYVPREPGLLP